MGSNITSLFHHGYYDPHHRVVDTPSDMGSNITLLSPRGYYDPHRRVVDMPPAICGVMSPLSPLLDIMIYIAGGGHPPLMWGVISPLSPPWILQPKSQKDRHHPRPRDLGSNIPSSATGYYNLHRRRVDTPPAMWGGLIAPSPPLDITIHIAGGGYLQCWEQCWG